MANTPEDICNLALFHCGHLQSISSLAADTSPAGIVCNAVYPHLRDKVLESVWWPFATKHATLAQLTYTRTGWAYAYGWPSGCIAPQYISNGIRRGAPLSSLSAVVSPALLSIEQLPLAGIGMRIPYAVELSDDAQSRIILCDASPAELVLTQQVLNVSVFPLSFVEALSLAIGAKVATAVLKKPELAKELQRQYAMEIAKAWSVVLRSEQEDPPADSEIIASRG